jgi:hypothetical protein
MNGWEKVRLYEVEVSKEFKTCIMGRVGIVIGVPNSDIRNVSVSVLLDGDKDARHLHRMIYVWRRQQ